MVFDRNARATVLQRLQQRQAVSAQCGHVQVFRFGHRRRHWSQRGYHGPRILYDAQGKFLDTRNDHYSNTISVEGKILLLNRISSNDHNSTVDFCRVITIFLDANRNGSDDLDY